MGISAKDAGIEPARRRFGDEAVAMTVSLIPKSAQQGTFCISQNDWT